jgi:hypothetical protein
LLVFFALCFERLYRFRPIPIDHYRPPSENLSQLSLHPTLTATRSLSSCTFSPRLLTASSAWLSTSVAI